MQTMADVLNQPIKIAKSEQTCALGAAMFAATAAEVYPTVSKAMKKMGAGFDKIYQPNPKQVVIYETLYREYSAFGNLIETK